MGVCLCLSVCLSVCSHLREWEVVWGCVSTEQQDRGHDLRTAAGGKQCPQGMDRVGMDGMDGAG